VFFFNHLKSLFSKQEEQVKGIMPRLFITSFTVMRQVNEYKLLVGIR
jgi:hypothetical protein